MSDEVRARVEAAAEAMQEMLDCGPFGPMALEEDCRIGLSKAVADLYDPLRTSEGSAAVRGEGVGSEGSRALDRVAREVECAVVERRNRSVEEVTDSEVYYERARRILLAIADELEAESKACVGKLVGRGGYSDGLVLSAAATYLRTEAER